MNALAAGIKRLLLIWHRRAGKDRTGMEVAKRQMDLRPANYWHFFPKRVQAERAIWDGIDPATGVRFLDQTFPQAWRRSANNEKLMVTGPNGATWQLLGSDYYDRAVGAPPLGVIFSEWALSDPAAWDFVRPILAENGGWAMFITTYRRRNHAWQMVQNLRRDPAWFVDVQTVDQTHKHDGSRIITQEAIDQDRRSGMPESLIQQEYYCNPVASDPGAVYGRVMEEILARRSGHVAYDPSFPVVASWSFKPSMIVAAFAQFKGNETAFIGSRSWPLTPLHECLAQCQALPWRAPVNVIGVDDDAAVFDNFGQQIARADAPANFTTAAWNTNAMLERASIDTVSRPFAGDTENNLLLVDSLNGYALPKRADGSFGDSPADGYERHMAAAVERLAAYQKTARHSKRVPRNYANFDRAVI